MTTASLILLSLGGALFLVRLFLGPSLANRIVALDGIVTTIVAALAVEAARTNSGIFLDAVVVVALVGFVASSAAARYIEGRGG